MEVKTVKATLLPPSPGKCQQCAADHDPAHPHNQESLFWQYWFHEHHGRWPTWKDAMAHCSPDVKSFWIQALNKRGISV